jgi:DNA polymerase-4
MGKGTDPLIAHIDLDSFFVAVERAHRPDIAGRAVIIGGKPGSRGRVAAVSREARRSGVRPGMSLDRAAGFCPEAIFLDGAVDTYLAAASRVDDILREETTEIEWISIDEVYIRLPREPVETLERVQQRLQLLGLDAACGLARSKVVARVASLLARPRGVVHVLGGYEARFLAPLKIEMLPGLDMAAARRLRAHGIRRLGQLASLSPAQILPLAGRHGAVLAKQAAGCDPTPFRRVALAWTRRTPRLFP